MPENLGHVLGVMNWLSGLSGKAGSQNPERNMDHEVLTGKIIGAAIRVHRELGPGYLESFYEEALCIELTAIGVKFARQLPVEVRYRGQKIGEHRLDLLVEDTVVVELKAVIELQDIYFATVRSYLRATTKSVGLLLNFAAVTLQTKRIGPDLPPRQWPFASCLHGTIARAELVPRGSVIVSWLPP
jgi:GxxExxY protein